MLNFTELSLNTKIIETLKKKGYETPTPIQEKAIPHLLNGEDLLGIAQTGTGKTAAFSLPILDNLCKSNHQVRGNNIRALIVTPTRELATQINDNIAFYSKGLGLRHIALFGGVSINNQIKEMKKGFDIVVATPGRFLDLKKQGHIRMSQVEVFVLDEADRMLDMGFFNDVKKIIHDLPKQRQTLLFSATMPTDIESLAKSILKNPKIVEITPQSTTVEKINQTVNFVEKSHKISLLKAILKRDDVHSTLIFSKTKHGANRIVDALEQSGVKVAAIHGNKSQAARQRALDNFRKGETKVLVATDIAARGIDIPQITHVINYDIPQDPSSYVHRIGRTARAGRSGIAISFCDRSERELLKSVQKVIQYQIPVDETHEFHGLKVTAQNREDLSDIKNHRQKIKKKPLVKSDSNNPWARKKKPYAKADNKGSQERKKKPDSKRGFPKKTNKNFKCKTPR